MTSDESAAATAPTPHPADRLERLLAESRFADADRYATEMLAKGRRGPRMLLAGGRAKMHLGDHAAALTLFREVATRHPHMKVRGLTGMTNALLCLRRWDEAEASLEAARAEGLDETVYWQRMRTLAEGRGDHETLGRVAIALFQPDRPRRNDLAQIVDTYMHTRDVTGLAGEIAAAEAADPNGMLARLLRAIRDELAGRPGVLVEELQRLRSEIPADGRDPLRAELPTNRANRGPANADAALAPLAAFMPTTAALKRPVVVDDPDADVLHADAAGSDVLAIVFTGLADRLTFPLPAFDAFMAEAGIPAVYLRDFDRLLYAAGVRSLGGAADTRRRLLEIANGRRIVTIGSSGGSFGALRWGLELKAERAILFSPVTSIASEFLDAAQDGRARLLLRRLHRQIPPGERDLAALLRAAKRPLGVDVHFATGNAVDTAHGENVAGIDGVTLHPVDCTTHGVLEPLILEGDFSERLRRLIQD